MKRRIDEPDLIFNTILPGTRWKAFLQRAARHGSQSNLDCDAFAAVARRWSDHAISRRGLVRSPLVPSSSLSMDSTNSRRGEMPARERQRRHPELMTLADANRIAVLEHMSASIVHDINQPVAAAVIDAQAALRFLKGPQPNLKEVRQALTRIALLGNWIVEVVGRSRALIRKVPPQKDDFEINDAIRETMSLAREVLVKNAVSVHTQFVQGMLLVRADRVQLQRVVLNLITNAVEAMSQVPACTRELRISTGQTHSGDILVVVQDSGPGLNAQNPDRVFDAFYTTKRGGLGIGLSICRSIINAHEGRLWVTQTEPRGAAFQFSLPGVPRVA